MPNSRILLATEMRQIFDRQPFLKKAKQTQKNVGSLKLKDKYEYEL